MNLIRVIKSYDYNNDISYDLINKNEELEIALVNKGKG
jgi:hypothetical protein